MELHEAIRRPHGAELLGRAGQGRHNGPHPARRAPVLTAGDTAGTAWVLLEGPAQTRSTGSRPRTRPGRPATPTGTPASAALPSCSWPTRRPMRTSPAFPRGPGRRPVGRGPRSGRCRTGSATPRYGVMAVLLGATMPASAHASSAPSAARHCSPPGGPRGVAALLRLLVGRPKHLTRPRPP